MRSKSIRHLLGLFCLLWLTIAGAADGAAQTGSFDEEIAKLSARNSLDAADVKPWHMVVSYTRYDAKDGIAGKAELWSLGKDRTRIEITEPERKGVYLLMAQGRLRSPDSKLLPQDVADLITDLVHPFPVPLVFEDEQAQDTDFKSVHARCLLVRQPAVSRSPTMELGKVPTFRADDKQQLRAVWAHGGAEVVNDATQVFQTHFVPTSATVYFGSNRMLVGKVDLLGSWSGPIDLASDGFVPDVFTGPVRISGAIAQKLRVMDVAPHYPQTAKLDHVTGSVVLAARIERDGRVGSLTVVSSPREDLSAAAIEAAKQWTYRPYVLNGTPVQVDTTITINFNLAP